MSEVQGKDEKPKVVLPKNNIKQIDVFYTDGTVESIIFVNDKAYSRTVYHG